MHSPPLHHLIPLFFVPQAVFSSITIRMSLFPAPPFPPPHHHPQPTAITTQQCTSLPPHHCCVPIDISETSSPTHGQRYIPRALDLRSSTPQDHAVNIWAGTGSAECHGPPVTRVEVMASRKWQKWRTKEGVRVTGFAIDTIVDRLEGGVVGQMGNDNNDFSSNGTGEVTDRDRVGVPLHGEEKKVTYPDEVFYREGLYRRYRTDRLEYVRVSHWGEGPGIIYGIRQGGIGEPAGSGGGGRGGRESDGGGSGAIAVN